VLQLDCDLEVVLEVYPGLDGCARHDAVIDW
jgi:hypothetical protein